jgi:glyoxylase-like metal-dependent hydrolase (beta-lactamase superfamily II)
VGPVIAELLPGVLRVTFTEVVGVGHVHCYLLRGPTGWTLVDTGLGAPGAAEAWRAVAGGLDAPLERVVVTHMHVDHLGGAGAVAPLARGPVLQGRVDRDQAAAAYAEGWPGSLREHLLANGVPAEEAEAGEASWRALTALVLPARTEAVDPGDRLDGWEVIALPGHADGQVGLLRDGVLVCGDALLGEITPNVGVWPDGDPDPLAHHLGTLAHIRALAPRLVLPGHGDPIADPAARTGAVAAHHRDRLDATAAALGPAPRTAYEVSGDLWPDDLDPGRRTLAVAETLAHLERLVRVGRAARAEDPDGRARFRAPEPAPARAGGAAPSR